MIYAFTCVIEIRLFFSMGPLKFSCFKLFLNMYACLFPLMNGTSEKHISMFLMYSSFFCSFLFHIFISLDGLLFQGRKVPTTKRVKTKGIPPISCMLRGPCARLFFTPWHVPQGADFFPPLYHLFPGRHHFPLEKNIYKRKVLRFVLSMVPKAENTVQPWWIPVAHCVAEVPLGVSKLRGQPVVLLCFSTRGFNKHQP